MKKVNWVVIVALIVCGSAFGFVFGNVLAKEKASKEMINETVAVVESSESVVETESVIEIASDEIETETEMTTEATEPETDIYDNYPECIRMFGKEQFIKFCEEGRILYADNNGIIIWADGDPKYDGVSYVTFPIIIENYSSDTLFVSISNAVWDGYTISAICWEKIAPKTKIKTAIEIQASSLKEVMEIPDNEDGETYFRFNVTNDSNPKKSYSFVMD